MQDLINVREGHALYESLSEETRSVIDAAYHEVADVFRKEGFVASGDDAAEELIGAITVYLRKSNGALNLR